MLYKKVLIAVDSSPISIKVAKMGFAFANQLNATAGLLFVVDRNKEVINSDLGITPEQSETVLLKQAEETIEQLIKMYDGVNEVLHFTPEGFPKYEIVKISKEWGADMIIMGKHGYSGFTHFLTGSITEYVIKHIGIPVMIVTE